MVASFIAFTKCLGVIFGPDLVSIVMPWRDLHERAADVENEGFL